MSIELDFILLEDDFKQWRDKFNRMISQIRLVEEYPEMDDKSGYILSNNGVNVEWISQESILENFGIKPGTGDITTFSDGIIIGDFAIILDSNGKATFKGDITTNGSVTAGKGFVGDLKGNVTGDITGNAGSATKLKTKRYIDGIPFDGSADIQHTGTCSTGASNATKVITCAGFSLYAGARISVTFSSTNTAPLKNVTFNVNGTGAKNFYIPLTAGVLNSSYPNGLTGLFFNGKNSYDFVYDGTAFILVNVNEPKYYNPANVATNLNDCIYTGIYTFETSSNISNIPIGNNGFMRVISRNPQNTSIIKQIWFRIGTVNSDDYHTFIRLGTGSGSTWSAWSRFLTDNGNANINGELNVVGQIVGENKLSITGTGYIGGATTLNGIVTCNNNLNVKGSASITQTLTASRVFNATFNDYAEFFERGEETEVGDIIALDENASSEQYIKAINQSNCVIGVHSDTYGHIIGGDNVSEEENLKKYIPVGMSGRVKVKFKGVARKGMKVVPSNIPGVGREFIKKIDNCDSVIGYLVENNPSDEIKLVRMKIR